MAIERNGLIISSVQLISWDYIAGRIGKLTLLNNSDYSQTKLISLHDGNTTLMDANCQKTQQKNKKMGQGRMYMHMAEDILFSAQDTLLLQFYEAQQ